MELLKKILNSKVGRKRREAEQRTGGTRRKQIRDNRLKPNHTNNHIIYNRSRYLS